MELYGLLRGQNREALNRVVTLLGEVDEDAARRLGGLLAQAEEKCSPVDSSLPLGRTMSAQHLERSNQLAGEALGLALEKRDPFLLKACDGDSDFLEKARFFLQMEEGVGTIGATDLNREPLAPGQTIGPYRIEKELGAGGMGVVFLAVREDDTAMKVALKVLKRGMDTRDLLDRFHKERRILASLKHPNIAQLHDSGATPDGLPFFVMEYVEGIRIDQYCDQQKLTIPQRLGLFDKVCGAVSYAHRNLVIHRDLKPANILVTPEGEPKLLDFGIAGLMDTTGIQRTKTAVGQQIFTLEYASPEQVKGARLTAASDVYSLGVLLFELLSGHPPYRFDGGLGPERHRAVCEQEPEKASTAITHKSERRTAEGTTILVSSEVVCRARSVEFNHLRSSLKGDLDNILLKVLRKDPEARYASVDRLAEDLERHLEGLPVHARPLTLRYRISTFSHRNKGKLAAAVVFVLLLLGFSYVTLQQQRSTARERDLARGERDAAQQVTSFLTQLFEDSDPGKARGKEMIVREVLDKGAEKIRGELEGQPEIRSRLMLVMGGVYQNLGLYEAAEPLLVEAVTQQRSLHESHPELASALHSLGKLRRKQGEYRAAEFLYRESLAMRRKLLGESHPDVAQSLNSLAFLLQVKGDHEAAEPLFRESLAMRRKLLGDDHPHVALSLNDLALLLKSKGDFEAAEPLYRESLALSRKLLGENHPDLATGLNNLAVLLKAKGDYGAAEPLFRESLAMKHILLGDDHPLVATGLNNLAFLLQAKGDYEAGEPLYRESLAMRRKLLEDDHPHVAASLNNLALLLKLKGDYEAAEPLYREALAMKRKLLGDDHPRVALSLNNLALLFTAKGDYEAAESLCRESLAMRRKLLGDDHPDVAKSLNNLAHLYTAKGDYDAAEPLYRESLAMKRKQLGDDHPNVAFSLMGLADTLTLKGHAIKGESLAAQALTILRKALPTSHFRIAEAESIMGNCLAGQHRFEEAEPRLLRGYEDLLAGKGARSEKTGQALKRLVDLYDAWGKPDRAARYRALATQATNGKNN